MRAYDLTRLSDEVLLRDLETMAAQERRATAAVLAHIAEVDARRLYLPAGFPSMLEYCLGRLRLSEDSALKRIQAARAARQFPACFGAVAEGWLHLTGLRLLAPHLTAANAGELLAAAANRSKSEIELLLAERFPRTELLGLVRAVPVSPGLTTREHAPGHVGSGGVEGVGALASAHAPGHVEAETGAATALRVPGHAEAPPPRSRVRPLAPQRFAVELTIGQETYDLLQYAQALLSHSIPSGDVAAVFHRALEALVPQLERRKFAATARPRPGRLSSGANPRSIPAQVKRAVWKRDQGRCAFVGTTGQRCPSREHLEYDHRDPVAMGGPATVANVRLLCRRHNAYAAERRFGARFMRAKLDEARRAAEARARAAAAEYEAREDVAAAEEYAHGTEAEVRSRSFGEDHARDVMVGLRQLGYRAGEARRAVEFVERLGDATLEERMRAALKFLAPRPRFRP